MKKIIVAIDGYSSSGKSTMARDLARRIGYVYVDSGAMYRAVTLYALRHGMVVDGHLDIDALVKDLPEIGISFRAAGDDGVQHTLLNGEDVEKEIRTMEVSGMVSPVAAVPEVRHRLTELQRGFGRDRGIVMDGRDIGTTVFPDAELKVFVDASAEVRAHRRVKELLEKGEITDYESVLANIRERDRIDTTRKESPLKKAEDAVVLDNDRMTIPQQMDWLMEKFAERTKNN
ncbi:MAG: (d)CMP kinase [Muribaculaceae bacterium]|nr:(d)CMP kinase [Muribaculaceae bacterium]